MRAEVESLLAKARESREAARILQREGYRGFAASRAYYAMFYAAEALLLERGRAYSSHSAVIAAFGREFAKTGVLDPKLHRYLIDAQDLRNVGDYDTTSTITDAQVQEIMEWTDEFLNAAEDALSDPTSE